MSHACRYLQSENKWLQKISSKRVDEDWGMRFWNSLGKNSRWLCLNRIEVGDMDKRLWQLSWYCRLTTINRVVYVWMGLWMPTWTKGYKSWVHSFASRQSSASVVFERNCGWQQEDTKAELRSLRWLLTNVDQSQDHCCGCHYFRNIPAAYLCSVWMGVNW